MTEPDLRQAVYDAAQTWKDRCLLGGQAIFSEERIWTEENVKECVQAFVERLDTGEGDFFQKLESQLAVASPSARKLFAEILWVMYLAVHRSMIGGEKKRLQIRQVYGWSGDEIPEDHWALGTLLDEGLLHPGTAYNTYRWKELVYFIEALKAWYTLSLEERRSLLDDPWRFAEWFRSHESAKNRLLRHIIPAVLFPSDFTSISSMSHKQRIVETFGAEAGVKLEDVDHGSLPSVDRALKMVREHVLDGYGADAGFYDPEVRERWDPSEEDETRPDDAAWVADRFGADARVWILAAGEGGRMWSAFRKEGIAAIGWDYLGDLSEYGSREEMTTALRAETGVDNPTNNSLACWEFCRVMKEGDVVLAREGLSRILGVGKVTGAYRFDDSRDEYQHVRAVDWEPTPDWELAEADRSIASKTLTDFTKYPHWIRAVFEKRDAGTDDGTNGSVYTLSDALRGLFMAKSDLQEILDTLASRKNVVLQGPPGVGKTFVARRIAWALLKEKQPERVEMVQFHQSYSYDDFVQGWRPSGDGFALRDGVFHQFCTRAATDPDRDYVFIIDEINRGNLSRIFGELLMLIEADKRGLEHAIPLTYSEGPKERFSVPANVHILGLMNTADRSLAIVDYALRRRFGFVTLRPAFAREAFQDHLLESGVDREIITLIQDRFRALNETIRADIKNLGPGYEIGHSYFVPTGGEAELDRAWYNGIVRTQILPLLEEYWFDRPDELENARQQLIVP